jgi:hypothetical protein
MVTGTITPAIDKAQIFVGVRKLSDAVYGMIVEGTAAAFGVISLGAPTNGRYEAASGGTENAYAISSISSYPVPITNVVSGLGDISGDRATLRVNGSQIIQITTNQGTGNFLAYPLYIGRRSTGTLPFNGQLYSLIVRFGANLTTNTITSTETYVNGKTGAYA